MAVQVLIKQKEFEEAVARKNLTYQELAQKLGVNRIYLSNIKNERYAEFRPSPKLRRKMMKVLGVRFDTIFKMITVNGTRKKKVAGPQAPGEHAPSGDAVPIHEGAGNTVAGITAQRSEEIPKEADASSPDVKSIPEKEDDTAQSTRPATGAGEPESSQEERDENLIH